MEAATGAPAAAEGQPTEGQVQEAQTQAPDIADWQRSVDQQLSSTADSVRQMAELVQTRLPEPQQEEAPDFDQQFADLFEQSGGYLEPQQISSLVREQAQAIAQEMVAPLQQQLGAFQQQMTAQELAGLQSEFPELSDQQAADQLAEAVVSRAAQMLPQGAPQEMFDGLVQNADFVRLVHLAEKASSRAQQETPAGQGQQIPQIETGGGAAPGSSSEGDEWDAFVSQRRPNGGIWG